MKSKNCFNSVRIFFWLKQKNYFVLGVPKVMWAVRGGETICFCFFHRGNRKKISDMQTWSQTDFQSGFQCCILQLKTGSFVNVLCNKHSERRFSTFSSLSELLECSIYAAWIQENQLESLYFYIEQIYVCIHIYIYSSYNTFSRLPEHCCSIQQHETIRLSFIFFSILTMW